MGNMANADLIKLMIPFIAIQAGLIIYCIVNILRRGTQNLNKPIWIIISATGTIGSLLFLIFGRKRWDNND
ncbi:MAG: PLDc N-terminal domain-containing protein [Bacillota bacterium]|nr:PLDc N-terminal domain-containing protein [Bacillota bacterium]